MGYENLSEHYASINYIGANQSKMASQLSKQSSSAFGNHLLHQDNDTDANAMNFYSYGTEDCSDYETEREKRAFSSLLDGRWADSGHSDTEHEDCDNNNKLVQR